MADSTDLILTAIVAPIVTGLVLFFIGLVIGRRLERKERSRQDDRARIYEPLYGQVLKLVSSEDSGERGFILNTPDPQVADEIVSHGLLVADRHRRLRQDVLALADLATKYNLSSYAFNVALTKAIETKVDPERIHQPLIDAAKSDTALNNALRLNDKEAGAARLQELGHNRISVMSGDYVAFWTRIFESIETSVAKEHAELTESQTALLGQGRVMRNGLDSALKRGKYRP